MPPPSSPHSDLICFPLEPKYRHMHIYIYIIIHVYIYICIYMCMSIHAYLCVHIYIFTYMCICIYIHTYTYIYIHKYVFSALFATSGGKRLRYRAPTYEQLSRNHERRMPLAKRRHSIAWEKNKTGKKNRY